MRCSVEQGLQSGKPLDLDLFGHLRLACSAAGVPGRGEYLNEKALA